MPDPSNRQSDPNEASLIKLPRLDRNVLEELRQYSDGDQDLATELIHIFLEDSQEQLLALQQALRTADSNEVERRSHRLKGSAGSIGALRLKEICQWMEDGARGGNVRPGVQHEALILNELEQLREELPALCRPCSPR